MKWITIIFCPLNDCQLRHVSIGFRKVCNFKSIPSTKGEYLVSDGDFVGISEFELIFNNFPETERVVKNCDIKMWRSIRRFHIEQ